MPGRNNTTPIGDGSVGLSADINSAAGQKIQQAVSRNNLNAALNGSDKSLVGLVEATIRMVNKWLPADKLRILQEFGSVDGVNLNRPDELNQACAIALISALPKNELRAIIGESKKDEVRAVKEMNKAKSNAKTDAVAYAKQYMTASKNREIYDKVSQYSGSSKDLLRNIAHGSGNKMSNISKPGKTGTFHLEDTIAKNAIPQLEKEVKEVLSTKMTTDAQLTMIANRMEITYDDGISRRSLAKKITNLILHYTVMLLGKSKGMYASRFTPTTVEQINNILLLTQHYGWLTGKVGMNDKTIKKLRDDAIDAKRQMDSNARKLKAHSKVVNKKKFMWFDPDTGEFKPGKRDSGNSKIVSSKAALNLVGKAIERIKNNSKINKFKQKINDAIARDVPEGGDKAKYIRNLAEKLNIDLVDETGTPKTTDQLITNMAQQMAVEQNEQERQLKAIAGIKSKKERETKIEEFKAGISASSAALLSSKDRSKAANDTIIQEYSDKLPIVTLSNNGAPIKAAAKAVPVWVVGNGFISQTIASQNKNKEKNKDRSVFDEAFDTKAFDKIVSKIKNEKIQDHIASLLQKKKPSNESNTTSKQATPQKEKEAKPATPVSDIETGDNDKLLTDYLTSKYYDKYNNYGDNEDRDIFNKYNTEYHQALEVFNAINKNVKKSNRQVAIRLKNTEDDNADRKYLAAFKDNINDLSYLLYKKYSFKEITPVMEVSKTSDYIADIRDDVTTMASDVSAIQSSVSLLPTLFSGLQMGGTAFNAATVGATAAQVKQVANDLVNAKMLDLTTSATGSTIKAKASTSSVITGDALHGNKANPELVNVDWAAQKIKVTPISTFATGGTATQQKNNSNISNINRMTPGERNKPLQVGISNGLVTYSKQFSDVENDGSNTAVKVYSINSGINEKIRIGENEISMFEAVYGVYTSVVSIEQAVKANTEMLGIIASNTTSISSSTSKIATSGNNESVFTFPSNLDSVLAGD